MPYVKTDRDNLQALSLPEMESIASFSSNNIAQVTEHDKEVLLEVEHISEHTTDN